MAKNLKLMATLGKKQSKINHNYTIEDYDDYAIVKPKKENSDFELKVIQFDESIIERLNELKELDSERHNRLLILLTKLKRMVKELNAF